MQATVKYSTKHATMQPTHPSGVWAELVLSWKLCYGIAGGEIYSGFPKNSSFTISTREVLDGV